MVKLVRLHFDDEQELFAWTKDLYQKVQYYWVRIHNLWFNKYDGLFWMTTILFSSKILSKMISTYTSISIRNSNAANHFSANTKTFYLENINLLVLQTMQTTPKHVHIPNHMTLVGILDLNAFWHTKMATGGSQMKSMLLRITVTIDWKGIFGLKAAVCIVSSNKFDFRLRIVTNHIFRIESSKTRRLCLAWVGYSWRT